MHQLPLLNLCTHPGCENKSRNKHKPGHCVKHYRRKKRHGNLNVKRLSNGAKGPYCPLFVTHRKNPYWATRVNGNTVLVHRLLAEIILGRKLHTHEHVHHKDHNSLNNHPDNLEILFADEHARRSHNEEPF